MKVIPEQYRCEICGRTYSTAAKAMACESRVAPVYPVGMVYGDHRPGMIYCDITLAVAEIRINKHWNESGKWACRDNGAGDSLGEEMCGTGFLTLGEESTHLDRNHPTFKRMVSYLKSQGIPITIWDGEKPVPYTEDEVVNA